VSRTGRITRSDYIEIVGVSPETASRDLARLVTEDLLVAEGQTRSRTYRLSPRFRETMRKKDQEPQS
jgi:predicted HTH transcriptional regulator